MVGRQSFLSGFRLELQQCIAGGKLFILKVTPLGKILTWAFVLVGNHQLWKSHPNFPNHRLPKCWNHHKNQLLPNFQTASIPQEVFLGFVFRGGGEIFYDFAPWDSSPFCTTTMWESIFCGIVLGTFFLAHHGRNRKSKYWRVHPLVQPWWVGEEGYTIN